METDGDLTSKLKTGLNRAVMQLFLEKESRGNHDCIMYTYMFILIFIKSAAHESLLSVFIFFYGNTHGMVLHVNEQKLHVTVAMCTVIYSVTQNWFASGWLL